MYKSGTVTLTLQVEQLSQFELDEIVDTLNKRVYVSGISFDLIEMGDYDV
jgi:hypothetical protein